MKEINLNLSKEELAERYLFLHKITAKTPLERVYKSLEMSRILRKLGVDNIHLIIKDIEKDWLEKW